MFNVQTVESLDHPELAPYRTMRQQVDHHDQGIFVAEGEKVVRRLLKSTLSVRSVLFPPKWLEHFRPGLEARIEDIQVFVAEKEILEKLTGFSMYQGVLALARIPVAVPLKQVLKQSSKPLFLAAADTLANAENLGGLVRNCAAFGVQALLVGETCASPYLRRAVRSSMGTVFQLPIVELRCLADALRSMRSEKVRCIAAHPHTDEKVLSQTELTGDCCLVFGSEGHGLSPDVLDACDEAVAIPMAPGVDSLNVGSASAAFLYEVARQRAARRRE